MIRNKINKNVKNKLNWTEFKLEIGNSNFSKELLESKLDIFWKEVIETKLSENQHIWLLFKLQWSKTQFVTIGKLIKLNKEDKDYLLEYILTNMEQKEEYYKEQSIQNMIFYFTIKKGRTKDKVSLDSSNLNIQYQYFHHHKLPITMNPLEYGILIKQIDNIFVVQVNRTNTAIIKQLENFNNVEFFKEGNLIYEYKDHKIDESTFIRSILNKHYTFKNNKLVVLTVEKTVNFIKNLKPSSRLINNIITLDIETFIKDGIHIPYVISWFDGEKSNSYYLLDFSSSNALLSQAIKDLMIRKYADYKIYIHNLANFDAIFLLKILTDLGDIKPIIHHGDLISINFKFKNYNLIFRDSLQILLVSLRKLTKVFGVDTQKSIFPYSFVNENNLDYIGPVPDFKYFDNISINEYNEYKSMFDNNHWNLKNEAIKYCEIDCVSLYQVIIKFSNMIFDLFKINIHKYPTLSSIAFAIFRTHFLKKDEVSQSFGKNC
jgi:DNA polymerase type B, organellar and viral